MSNYPDNFAGVLPGEQYTEDQNDAINLIQSIQQSQKSIELVIRTAIIAGLGKLIDPSEADAIASQLNQRLGELAYDQIQEIAEQADLEPGNFV